VRVRVNGAKGSGKPTFEFATRTDLFSNREHVRDGFNAAFVPFLPALEK
jgi:hypothetical protein